MNAANKPTVAPQDAAGVTKAKVGEHLLDRIGDTPLLHLERIVTGFPNVEFYAKAEWFNPGGSVKDRAGYSMIRAGERSGDLRPGKIILDATSGNTGIAYAMIGAALGYRVKLCLPTSAVCAKSTSPIAKNTFTLINTAILQIPPRTTPQLLPKSGSKPTAPSPISSRASAPPAHSLAPRAA